MTKEHEQDRALLHDLHRRLAAGLRPITEAETNAVIRLASAYKSLAREASLDREMLLACDEDSFALVDVLAQIVLRRSGADDEQNEAKSG